MKKQMLLLWLLTSLLCIACQPGSVATTPTRAVASTTDWEKILQEKLPLLGHRNWIVVTDMAYPLQSKEGITTLYADASGPEVLAVVKHMIDQAPHIYAHAYQDKELSILTEQLCPGIDSLRQSIYRIIPAADFTAIEHEQLIARLDRVSNLFQVILIKTNQTFPYSSIFMELDCKYWDDARQKELNSLSASHQP